MFFVSWILVVAGCATDPPAPPSAFSCEAFSEPDDCLQEAAVQLSLTCPVPAGEVGELDASRTECTFSDGTVVTFDPPVTDVIEEGAPLEMWIDHVERITTDDGVEEIPHACRVYTFGDSYPLEVGYEVDDLVESRWYQDSEDVAISISCDPQTAQRKGAAAGASREHSSASGPVFCVVGRCPRSPYRWKARAVGVGCGVRALDRLDGALRHGSATP